MIGAMKAPQLQRLVVALVLLSCAAFGAWFWRRAYRDYVRASQSSIEVYNLSRIPDAEEVAEARRASCAAADRSKLVPALRVPPDYPELARAQGIEGAVELEFLVSTEGTVAEVRVRSSEPPEIFDRAARHAVSYWHYCPIAEATRSQVRLAFELDEVEADHGDCDHHRTVEERVLCRMLSLAHGT